MLASGLLRGRSGVSLGGTMGRGGLSGKGCIRKAAKRRLC